MFLDPIKDKHTGLVWDPRRGKEIVADMDTFIRYLKSIKCPALAEAFRQNKHHVEREISK